MKLKFVVKLSESIMKPKHLNKRHNTV